MFEKTKLKREIKKCNKLIVLIEKKRYRSQASLVASILNSEEPDEADVEYFNQYSEMINSTREKMHDYQKELEKIEKS